MAVYTSLNSNDAEDFVKNYNIGSLISFKGISGGVTNSNFFIQTDHQEVVLTIFEELVASELNFYFEFMHHLSEHGFSCPNPIQDKEGIIVQTLRKKPAALLTKIPGKVHEEINENQLRALGFALAKMHELSKSFNGHKENNRNLSWMKKTYQSISDCLNDSVKNLISEELIYLQDLPSDLPKGIIHADLFRDNVLFEDDTIGGIIDFYYACTDYFIYDIAIVINDWCTNNDGSINRTRQEIFLEAYDKNRVLKQKEYDALGGYLRLAAMRFLLSRYRDQLSKKEAELNQPKDPLFFQEILSLRRLGK